MAPGASCLRSRAVGFRKSLGAEQCPPPPHSRSAVSESRALESALLRQLQVGLPGCLPEPNAGALPGS